jgi:hypothetical protein
MLKRLFPREAQALPAYRQNVEIVFTSGKSDPMWREGEDDAAGHLASASVWASSRRMDAIIAVDIEVDRVVTGGGTSLSLDGSSSKGSFIAYRRKMFETIAHEYFHALQSWKAQAASGRRDGFDRAYQDETMRARWQVFCANPLVLFDVDRHIKLGYFANRFENDAKRAAAQALHVFREEVDTGLWDSLLPIREMQAH